MIRKRQETHRYLPLIDFGLAFVAFFLAYLARYELEIFRPLERGNFSPFAPYLPYALIFAFWMVLNIRGSGLYRVVRGRAYMEEFYSIINAVAMSTVIILALSFFLQPLVFSRLMLVFVAVLSVVLLAGGRVALRMAQARLRRKGIGVQRTLIVGAGDVGQAVLRTMLARKELGYVPVGYLDDNPDRGSTDIGRVRGLGPIDALEEMIKREHVDLVVITLKWSHHDRILKLVQLCQRYRVEARVVPDVFQLHLRQVQVENLDGIPLLGVGGTATLPGSSRVVKRAIDIGLIMLASPLLIPMFLIISLLIKLEDGATIYYSQWRVGENGRLFRMFKFRSMIPDAERLRESLVKANHLDPRHPKLVDDPRVTRTGRFLRRTSLDELPNLINVIRGHMSLVGPRPPTPDEVALYEPWHMQRLQIMPGITGLWQINGRSDVPFEEMCLLDIYYIENWSIRLDAQILMMTLPRVLLRQGAY
jgi:exopolysaccharide biosynthesis polyprenyl glycosylphosphotransferase